MKVVAVGTERLEVMSVPNLKRPVLVVTIGNVSRIIARFESDEAKDEFLSFELRGAERTVILNA